MLVLLAPAVVLALLFLDPSKAYAWGPVTHLQIGLEALRSLALLEHSLRMLLQSYPYDFLYGCIGADIIFAKGLARLHEHSHNWTVGWAVLDEASSPAQEAFSYGYLSHLAADTVAHNRFIPECVVRTYPAKSFRHLYWEVRFDAFAKKDLWDLAQEIARFPQSEDDELIERVVKRTLFSFKTDKKIFNSIIVLNRMRQWQTMLQNHSWKSVWKLNEKDVAHYRRLAFEANLDFLVHQKGAACLNMDPIGKEALLSAKWVRRSLRTLKRKGQLDPALYHEVLRVMRPDLISTGFPPPAKP